MQLHIYFVHNATRQYYIRFLQDFDICTVMVCSNSPFFTRNSDLVTT